MSSTPHLNSDFDCSDCQVRDGTIRVDIRSKSTQHDAVISIPLYAPIVDEYKKVIPDEGSRVTRKGCIQVPFHGDAEVQIFVKEVEDYDGIEVSSSDCHFFFELANGELYPEIESTTTEQKNSRLEKWGKEFLASVIEVDGMRVMSKLPGKSYLRSPRRS